MRKFIVSFWLLALILCALPANSFADRPLIFWNEGEITGLDFYFGKPGLPVDLSEIGIGKFKAVSVGIETSGNEIALIVPDTKEYYYYGEYGSGTITAYSKKGEVIIIPMVSAALSEHFVIEGSLEDAIANPFIVPAPSDTSLIFRAVLGEGNNTVRFALVVQYGEVIFAGTY